MKKKILATSPLLIITGLAGTGFLQSAQATQVVENSLKKEFTFQDSSSSGGDDFAAILIAVGVILALGTTVSVLCKAPNVGKPSSKMANQHTGSIAIEDTTSSNKQIAPAAYIEQAHTSFRQGDVQRAITQLNHAVRVHPHEANLYTERANFRRRNLEDRLGALEDYTQAINLHPDNALFYLWRSQLYYEIGDHLKAMADHNTATRLAPQDTMYHLFPTHVNSVRR